MLHRNLCTTSFKFVVAIFCLNFVMFVRLEAKRVGKETWCEWKLISERFALSKRSPTTFPSNLGSTWKDWIICIMFRGHQLELIGEESRVMPTKIEGHIWRKITCKKSLLERVRSLSWELPLILWRSSVSCSSRNLVKFRSTTSSLLTTRANNLLSRVNIIIRIWWWWWRWWCCW